MKVTIRAIVSKAQNVDFIETCFARRTDFVVIRYGTPSSNLFGFQGNRGQSYMKCMYNYFYILHPVVYNFHWN
jgi:hypothetical protein